LGDAVAEFAAALFVRVKKTGRSRNFAVCERNRL
jgi:hypothetical protein